MTPQEKLIAWWRDQIGYREGENNYTKYAENQYLKQLYGWKPQNQPWCDILYDVSMIECFGLKAASEMTYQPIGSGSALCRTSAQYYKNNNAWYKSPEVGDQIFFLVDGAINHTGIVESVGMGAITTIEGNTSDMAARRTYSLNDYRIAGYGRPNWSVVSEMPVDKTPIVSGLPVLKRGSKGEVVRAAQILLNGRGANVGKWGADGDYGGATESAVLAYQRRNGLTVDGIVGQRTWEKLLGV